MRETVHKLGSEIRKDPDSATTLTLLAEANGCDSRLYLWVLRLRSGGALLCLRSSSRDMPYAVRQCCDLVEFVEGGEVIVQKDRDALGGSGFRAHEEIPMIVTEEAAPQTLWARLNLGFAT